MGIYSEDKKKGHAICVTQKDTYDMKYIEIRIRPDNKEHTFQLTCDHYHKADLDKDFRKRPLITIDLSKEETIKLKKIIDKAFTDFIEE